MRTAASKSGSPSQADQRQRARWPPHTGVAHLREAESVGGCVVVEVSEDCLRGRPMVQQWPGPQWCGRQHRELTPELLIRHVVGEALFVQPQRLNQLAPAQLVVRSGGLGEMRHNILTTVGTIKKITYSSVQILRDKCNVLRTTKLWFDFSSYMYLSTVFQLANKNSYTIIDKKSLISYRCRRKVESSSRGRPTPRQT